MAYSLNREGHLRTQLLMHAITILKPGETCTLASGKVMTSGYYADMRHFTTLPRELELLADSIMAGPLDRTTKYLGAVPTGGLIPLGAIGIQAATSSIFRRLQLFYVREAKKGHGKQQQVEGWLADDGPAVMLEDVVNTGESLVRAIKAARRERKADINTAICILDRENGGRQALANIGVELRPLFTASGLGLPACSFA